ncbi:MAG: hypothetical protein MRY83_06310 [Flavobacteriales bacterium]|nr:hypothetical protein [Flavobacteriales bacterium]
MRFVHTLILVLSSTLIFGQTIYTVRKKSAGVDIEIAMSTNDYVYHAYYPGTSNHTADVIEITNGNSLNARCDCELYEDGVLVENNTQTRHFATLDYVEQNGSSFSSGGYVNWIQLNTWNGSVEGTISIDMNPSTTPYLSGPAGTAAAANLTYTFPNMATFASALQIVLRNGLAANGYTYSNISISMSNPWRISITSEIIDNPTTNVAGFTLAGARMQMSYSPSGGALTTGLQGVGPNQNVSGDFPCKTNYVNPVQYLGSGSGYGSVFGCCYLRAGDFDLGAWLQPLVFNSKWYNYVYIDPAATDLNPVNVTTADLTVTFNTACTSPSYNWEGLDGAFWQTVGTGSSVKVQTGDGGQYRVEVTCNEGTYVSPTVTP